MNKKLLVLFFILIHSFAWWNPAWNLSKSLNADKNISLITGYFTLDTASLISAGKLRYDCADLRVTTKSSVDMFFTNCNTSATAVFFDVDFSGDAFYLYYNNPDASKSTTTSFFDFYDGFDSYFAGSSGSPIWTSKFGSFKVNYTNSSWRMTSNTSIKSISTSYTPTGNFSIFSTLIGDKNLGIVYGYVSSTNYSAVFLNTSGVWIREQNNLRKLSTYSDIGVNTLLLKVISNVTTVYVNGVNKGIGTYQDGLAGIYSNGTNNFFDDFIIFKNGDTSWTLGSEEIVPELILQFIGSDVANMRTLSAKMSDSESLIKFSLIPQEISGLINQNEAVLNWATINFNSTGYSVDGTFFKIDADNFNFTQGDYRFDLTYVKTTKDYKKWHIVQFFNDYSAIKHILFVTANNTGTFNLGVEPSSSCTSYISTTGTHSCESTMHSSGGIFNFGSTSFCGIHSGTISPNKVFDNISMSSKEQYKKIFWQSYRGCENFTSEVELLCGTDFNNCSATVTKPAKVLFYLNANPGPLTRIEYPPGFNCKINQNSFTDLVDSKKINRGLNDLECYGTGDLTYFRLYSSNPFEATRFFGEKPELYKANILGPASRGKIKLCGVPIVNSIIPFVCSDQNMFIEYNFTQGYHDFYIFKTKHEYSFNNPNGGPNLPVTLKRALPINPPLAGARDMGTPISPPTHALISSRRLFYSKQTAVEMVISAWKSI